MKNADIFVVLLVVGVVVMMIIPLPTFLLDILLSLNITLSLTILMATMYNKEALQFSIFPSLLLLTTLFRLALNISSTRLILLHGDAGEVIRAFGNFVVGGEPVVGFIIFLILVIIQFLVITKGAERVAEVAARFTLDAMPGKQMAIDADLNSGLITEEEARIRRKNIQREADFYGAMDGASKFVKGDAIAGIIINVINILAGFVIGVVRLHMPWQQALNTYTLLTVGDGLVSQIPALLISTATGIIVTRAASDSDMGQDLVRQIFGNPRVLLIASGVLVFFGLVPSLPKIPFFLLAGLFGYVGYTMRKTVRQAAAAEGVQDQAEGLDKMRKPENVLSMLQIDPIGFEFGYGLFPLADNSQGGDLLDRVIMIRRQIALELGLVVPVIRLRDNIQLRPNQYVIKIKGIEVAGGELMLNHYLAMNPGFVEEPVEGIPTTEPAFGLPAWWIPEGERENAELKGYTVVDPPSVVATHLSETLKKHAHELLGRQEVQALLDNLKQSYPAVVEELTPKLLSLGEIQKVLANLLKEGVSIRDLLTICETLADYATLTKDPDILTEYVRQALARAITKQYVTAGNPLYVLQLDPGLEKMVLESVRQADRGSYLAMDPVRIQQILAAVDAEIGRFGQYGQTPVVLTSPMVRVYFKRLTERAIPALAVLSYNELLPNVEVKTLGMVKLA